MDLHLALHQQLVITGIVGCTFGLAVALFEDEAGRLVGIDACREVRPEVLITVGGLVGWPSFGSMVISTRLRSIGFFRWY